MKSAQFAIILVAFATFVASENQTETTSKASSPESTAAVSVTYASTAGDNSSSEAFTGALTNGTTVEPTTGLPVTTRNTTDLTTSKVTTKPEDPTTRGTGTATPASPTVTSESPSSPTTASQSPTAAPVTSSVGPSCVPKSGFDGASFVGGIVLALGIIVILVVIVKCYHHHTSKTELQYSQF